MPRISITTLAFLLSATGLAEGPVFGGNLPAIRPGHVGEDSVQFDLALSYLQPGDVARVQTVAWEVLWDPKGPYDFRGIDTAIKKMAEKGVTPLWLLQPCPYPSSAWYKTAWKDWWMPSREVWRDVVKMNTKIARHIVQETQDALGEKPLFQLWNEPQKGKPGGSNSGKSGEWHADLHELLFLLATDLRAVGITKSQIVGPAISSFGEGASTESTELSSMMPPKEFDWLSLCGYRDLHVRLSAGGANGDLALVKAGMKASLNHAITAQKQNKWPSGQQVMVTEFYVTPGDVGVPVGTDMSKFHAIAFDLLKEAPFTHIVAWGLRPDEKDAPNNAWAHFGGVGDSLVKWRKG